MSFFSHFPQDNLDVIAPDGRLKGTVTGVLSEKEVQIPDEKADIDPGDELRRLLPNGKEQVFTVESVNYSQGLGGAIPPHYTAKIRQKGSFPRHTGGHYINVSGNNARVNLHSSDQSTNVVVGGDVFGELVEALRRLPEGADRDTLIATVNQMKEAQGHKGKFFAAYQSFIGLAADHLTLIGPFLPALAAALQ